MHTIVQKYPSLRKIGTSAVGSGGSAPESASEGVRLPPAQGTGRRRRGCGGRRQMAERERGRLLGREGPAFSSRLKTAIRVSIASGRPVAAPGEGRQMQGVRLSHAGNAR